jgi:hypothetical protein
LEQQVYLRKIKGAGFNRVEVMSSKEFYSEGGASEASPKLLTITVEA